MSVNVLWKPLPTSNKMVGHHTGFAQIRQVAVALRLYSRALTAHHNDSRPSALMLLRRSPEAKLSMASNRRLN